MENKEAIKHFEEVAKCKYKPTREVAKLALASLRAQEEAEIPPREGFEYVKNVEVSEQLAKLLRQYRGCPRGSMGPSVGMSAVELLRNASGYVIAGPDDKFVCVPKWDYEVCLKALENGREAEKNEPLTIDELRQMMGRPVWCESGYGNSEWCLVSDLYSDNDCVSAIDGDTGLWDGAFYGMTGDGKHGLHSNGWLAYRHPPKEAHDD